MVRLAREPGGAAVLGRDLARDCGIPANYLSKLLWQLKNAGLVSTARGSGGGYRLERSLDQIRLVDIVEVFDALRTRPPCLLGQRDCNDFEPCAAHREWKKLRNAYIGFLETSSLADIAAARRETLTPAGLNLSA